MIAKSFSSSFNEECWKRDYFPVTWRVSIFFRKREKFYILPSHYLIRKRKKAVATGHQDFHLLLQTLYSLAHRLDLKNEFMW